MSASQALALSGWVAPTERAAMDGDERELFAALARGDRAAAEELVERTYRQVWALSVRLCGDPDRAADLVQETYRKAWAGLSGFSGRSRFSTWLYRIATNTFLNQVRRPHRLVALDEDCAAVLPDPAPGADQTASDAEIGELLRRAVLALPSPQRDAVIAHYWGEVPVAEIAAGEKISEVAVRKRLRRALAALARALEEAAP
jgi:RNA polymerase sigma-70 factor (ECF subfamily)